MRIEKDPDITTLTQEARRLSMGSGRKSSGQENNRDIKRISPRTSSNSLRTNGSVSPRRSSKGYSSHSPRRPSEGFNGTRQSPRRQSDAHSGRHSPGCEANERTHPTASASAYRRESLGLSAIRKNSDEVGRRPSEERRFSEAGFSRRYSNNDEVLNHDPDSLRIGQVVWVDGNKQGRIAFIGNVQFAKGEVAGVHLLKPYGKNNGTVGGVMYFECEPKHGIFARLHRITTEPLEE